MPAHGNSIPSFNIDLARVTEETRRALYDAVVALHFNPTPDELRRAEADPDDHWVPTYGPDEAGLVIYHFVGRWFAVWRSLEEVGEDVPEERRWTVLRIGPDPDGNLGGLAFHEV